MQEQRTLSRDVLSQRTKAFGRPDADRDGPARAELAAVRCVCASVGAAAAAAVLRCRGYDADFQRTILIRTKLDKWYPDLSPSNINDWASFFL